MDLESIKEKIKLQEGSIEHMYLDTRGFVTVGVGYLLATEDAATHLNFVFRHNGQVAPASEIVTEYRELKSKPVGLVASHYKEFTKLILQSETIEYLLEEHIRDFESGLTREFPEFPIFPPSAQEALMDMAFNLGLAGLMRKFPTFVKGVRKKQWDICARECHRRGISDLRNHETEQLFLQAEKEQD